MYYNKAAIAKPFCGNRLEVSNDNIHKTSLISTIPFLAPKYHTIFRMEVQFILSNHVDPKVSTVSKQTDYKSPFSIFKQ